MSVINTELLGKAEEIHGIYDDPEQAAREIVEDLYEFTRGNVPSFRRYFVLDNDQHAMLESQFLRELNIDGAALDRGEEAQLVGIFDGTQLFCSSSFYSSGELCGSYYEAVRPLDVLTT